MEKQIFANADIFSTTKDQTGQISILTRNGQPQFCPMKNLILLPGKFDGQMLLHREPCGEWCPKFKKIEGTTTEVENIATCKI